MKIIPLLFTLGFFMPSVGFSYPNYVTEFCQKYPSSPHCVSNPVSCAFCHSSASGGPRNPFGKCIQDVGTASGLAKSLSAVEPQDCDGDNQTNLEEIVRGTQPGVADVATGNAGSGTACQYDPLKDSYNVCGYDANFAFRRIHRDFCGRSPTMADDQSFRALESELDKVNRLHDTLDDCLNSDHWRGKDGVLWRMGYLKIAPYRELKSGPDGGKIPLGDYDDDFNLFAFHHVDGNDVRGLLAADYFAMRDESVRPIKYVKVEDVPAATQNLSPFIAIPSLWTGSGSQQLVVKNKRAGLITTAWSFGLRSMFTSVERGLASSTLANYLGFDIAQGKLPPVNDANNFIPTIFQDWDNKGVLQQNSQSNCRGCHVALDPITYPFSKYNGFTFGTDQAKVESILKGLPLQQKIAILKAIIDLGKAMGDAGGGMMNVGIGDIAKVIEPIINVIPLPIRLQLIDSGAIMLPYMFAENRAVLLAPQVVATEPNLANLPRTGFFIDTQVSDLPALAKRAIAMDQFFQTVTRDYWIQLFRREPNSVETAEFDQLWKAMKAAADRAPFPASRGTGPNVQSMLHQLITMEAYGAP
jgi:hypothetical protein